jgi:purine-binding chemotaxis protein CheW
MTASSITSLGDIKSSAGSVEYVAVLVAGQLLGLPISRVHDVYLVNDITAVPLAPPEIAGLLNLRGRVVTAISLRRRLGLNEAAGVERRMTIGIEHQGEAFGLLVDDVGEVLRFDPADLQPNPVHLDRRWASLAKGVYQVDRRLLIILDVDAVLEFLSEQKAA